MTVNDAGSLISNDWVVIHPLCPTPKKETSLDLFHSTMETVKFQGDTSVNLSKHEGHQPLNSSHSPTLKKTADQFALNLEREVHRDWGKAWIDEDTCFTKMIKNLEKAYEEHIVEYNKFLNHHKIHPDIHSNPYADPQEWGYVFSTYACQDDQLSKSKHFFSGTEYPGDDEPKFTLSYGWADAQGVRPTMEDAKITIQLKDGLLVGVFDGHGGKEVAELASVEFSRIFPQQLEAYEGNVHQAFEKTFLMVNKKIVAQRRLDSIGSTAVVSYIDLKHSLIYTATIGDSEGFICRENSQNELKLIPLSCVRDWTSEKDILRVSRATHGQYIIPVASYWRTRNVRNKDRRIDRKMFCLLNNDEHGLNVSRAFGDSIKNQDRLTAAVIAKPKITVCPIKKGDFFLFVCDGVIDYVNKEELVNCISMNSDLSPRLMSLKVIELAFNCATRDNVTVVIVKTEELL